MRLWSSLAPSAEDAKTQSVVQALQSLIESSKESTGGGQIQQRTSLEDFIDWFIDWLLNPEYRISLNLDDNDKKRLLRVASLVVDRNGDGKPQEFTKDDLWIVIIILICCL